MRQNFKWDDFPIETVSPSLREEVNTAWKLLEGEAGSGAIFEASFREMTENENYRLETKRLIAKALVPYARPVEWVYANGSLEDIKFILNDHVFFVWSDGPFLARNPNLDWDMAYLFLGEMALQRRTDLNDQFVSLIPDEKFTADFLYKLFNFMYVSQLGLSPQVPCNHARRVFDLGDIPDNWVVKTLVGEYNREFALG